MRHVRDHCLARLLNLAADIIALLYCLNVLQEISDGL
jgi:hypothetical protein